MYRAVPVREIRSGDVPQSSFACRPIHRDYLSGEKDRSRRFVFFRRHLAPRSEIASCSRRPRPRKGIPSWRGPRVLTKSVTVASSSRRCCSRARVSSSLRHQCGPKRPVAQSSPAADVADSSRDYEAGPPLLRPSPERAARQERNRPRRRVEQQDLLMGFWNGAAWIVHLHLVLTKGEGCAARMVRLPVPLSGSIWIASRGEADPGRLHLPR